MTLIDFLTCLTSVCTVGIETGPSKCWRKFSTHLISSVVFAESISKKPATCIFLHSNVQKPFLQHTHVISFNQTVYVHENRPQKTGSTKIITTCCKLTNKISSATYNLALKKRWVTLIWIGPHGSHLRDPVYPEESSTGPHVASGCASFAMKYVLEIQSAC